ncbi:ABC transporter ATP-binding protein [Caldimicrobium thiodismutans]|jgi:ABC-2 type transport system ATP-binding protein|uniref:ABC transporter ATP-binding protein n=1 Tax=Caldimicrobium thiodismutans TaxID=1653476 RepID=A0A0U5AMY8_9BACT|nr:ABC transporter ATP-binding protein [Caldimicrobium thiodismutans]BAU23218.1 ABC transporter ATP-binding protein [Caldimicrobium thiodismutans]
MNPLLKVKGLSKSFGEKVVLRDISFEVNPKDILGIIGPNGAGKSSLLYLLLGIITPDQGEILYFGKDFFKERSLLLEKVGFASHYVSLPFSLSVKENLRIFGHLYGVKASERRIDELLELFKLKEKADALTRTLSSGEMMRLNLVRANLSAPKILLLDEPTAGLDPEYIRYVAKVLKDKAQKEELAIILTSHQLGELERMVNKLLLLKEGQVIGYGSVDKLFQRFEVTDLEELYFKVFGDVRT